jgi:TamB, inner membrane protein subunit of TAM complex
VNLSIRLRQLIQHRAIHVTRRGLMIAAAILAVMLVSLVTIDLGPAVRRMAEARGSQALKRPIHIGKLSIHLLTGSVLVDNISIEGLKPSDRPFFTAKHVEVSLDWGTLARKEVTVERVEMTDWQMLVEKWADAHNFPKFTSDEPDTNKKSSWTFTLKWLHAYRGQFTFDDHEKPWSTIARNLDITIRYPAPYHGEATFTGGTVAIQDYVPMWANMHALFSIDKGTIHLPRIDLETDGATSVASGEVDMKHWPEQTYRVKSRVHFPRMREIFFAHETWRLAGDGDFNGVFHLFKGGHDLHGTFKSDLAGVNDYRFPSLYGSLRWTPAAFDVWDAGSKFYGGDARFTYSIKPLGSATPPTDRFDASYTDVDLSAFTDFEQFPGLRFAGRASGGNVLEWPAGHFAEHHGGGHVVVAPLPGVVPMTASLAAARAADALHTRHEWGPFAPIPLPWHLPIAGELTYRFDPARIEVDPSRFATERTYVSFQGDTAWGEASRFPFHVTSSDWQESDQVLAGIITDFGSRTGAVAFGGRGEFDGVMTGAFKRPRVEGLFSGEDLRAWDTLWGSGTSHIVVENGYVRAADASVRLGESEIHADGLFSLGYPRDDRGEEINARFRVVGRDIDSLRHAFQLDDYAVTGLLSGDFHLTGQYERPIGFGGMTIDRGAAYGEPFQKATASLRFDGAGIRLDGMQIEKNGGAVTGAAYVGWDSTYSFNADARRVPVERITAFTFPKAPPLSGIVEFTAGGSGTFDQPRYDVRFHASGLFIGEEGIGEVTGTLALRGKELSGDVAAVSPRLAVNGTGRIALTPQADAEMTFQFHDSSLDPYVRLFEPRLSPFTTAVASGTIRVVGELADIDHLLVDVTVDTLDMRMFDYGLKNAAPIRLALDQRVIRVDELQLIGDLTELRVSGTVGLRDQQIALQAAGDANLGILQGFFRDVRGSGRAELRAAVNGPLHDPLFSGSATITDGRIRHFSLPNSLDAINGTIYFDERGIRLDDVKATMGEGRVQFGGRVGLEGYVPGTLNVTARGEDMHLRYPEGVRSVVDADLVIHGSFKSPTLGGTVTVKNAEWTRRIDAPGSLFDLTRRSSTGGGAGGGAVATAVPLKFDLQILIPSTLHVDNNLLKMTASADLQLRGTYDRPLLFGHAEVDRGELLFEGRRYKVTRGTIDFTNPTRIDPFFDVEAETSVRVPYQTYRVTVRAAGTTERLQAPTFESDPPLPSADVVALLFSEARRDERTAELRALQNPNQRQTDILTTRATLALSSPLSEGVGKVVEQNFGVDTFQLTPTFIDPYSETARVNPSARLTIGKRISDRAYLTFSRSLNSPQLDQIILLEYDATDRLSWVLSRNEDASYALEFRVRHVF